jgi:hypothetical protein
MTNPHLGLDGGTPHRSRPRSGRLRVIGGVVLVVVAMLVLLGYWLGTSTARGWRTLVAAAADSVEVYDQPTILPQGSRVTYRGSIVGQLTAFRRLPREQSLGGPLLVFDGSWESGAIAERVRADTALIGTVTGDAEQGRPVIIDLRDQPPPSRHPQGLLRLQPFHRGYSVY